MICEAFGSRLAKTGFRSLDKFYEITEFSTKDRALDAVRRVWEPAWVIEVPADRNHDLLLDQNFSGGWTAFVDGKNLVCIFRHDIDAVAFRFLWS